MQIYVELEEIERQFKHGHRDKPFSPALNVPTNPITWRGLTEPEAGDE